MVPSSQATVVFSVVRLPSGGWRLETSGGDVGGLFTSKHAALTFACGQAEWCHAPSVRIEVDEPVAAPSLQ
jgi:hypothetical protein